MKKVSLVCLFMTVLVAPCIGGVAISSSTATYELRTSAGSDSDSLIASAVTLFPCDSAVLVSAYSSDYCWSSGAADPLDSAWALLYGNQIACANFVSGADEVTGIISSTNITGGVIYTGCDLGDPVQYEADGFSEVGIVLEVINSPTDYVLSYSLLGEDWGGEIMGGITAMSGYLRFSKQGGPVLMEDTLFLGAIKTDIVSSGTLQPGTYEISYEISHSHSGVESLSWFPNGQSNISFVLEFGSILCGDVDNNSQIDITDAVYLINYIFAGGPAPQDSLGGDLDCSNQTDITDAVYLINYIFAGGPSPCAACL